MGWFRKNFLTGLVILLPTVVTGYVLYRFFVFMDGGSSYKILGRDYEKALVLAKFGNVGGFDNIGINPTTHSLNGSYRRLLEDNSLGPIINEITLGFGEGAILIREGTDLAPPDASPPTPTPSPTPPPPEESPPPSVLPPLPPKNLRIIDTN